MSTVPAPAVLGDCALCFFPVVPDVDDNLVPIDRCTGCGLVQRSATPLINLRDLQEQVATVREQRPVLCDPCVVKRCTACETPDCDCPRTRHPRRPVGDLTDEGLALIAAETPGHLTPAEVA